MDHFVSAGYLADGAADVGTAAREPVHDDADASLEQMAMDEMAHHMEETFEAEADFAAEIYGNLDM